MIPVTVVTPTIPERRQMLHELGQCIARQTAHPYEWIVRTDRNQAGPAAVVNEMVAEAETEWVFRCDDDDLFDTNHFETIGEYLTDDVDIVYSWPRVSPGGWMTETELQVNNPIELLRQVNWIASAAAIRTDLWDRLGGYREVHNEDHDLWIRALDAGATFRCLPVVTWTYRQGDWPHLSRPEGIK